jgi:hypothetical protein
MYRIIHCYINIYVFAFICGISKHYAIQYILYCGWVCWNFIEIKLKQKKMHVACLGVI